MPELVPADRASIALVVTGEELEIIGLEGAEGALPLGRRFPIDESLAGRAVRSAETRCWNASDHHVTISAEISSLGIVGIINAPLLGDGSVIGTINVGRIGQEYDPHHVRLLTDIAALISLNLERFRALARTREELLAATRNERRLECLGRISRGLSSAMTEGEAFDAVAQRAADVLPVDRVSLAFPDHKRGVARIAQVSQRVEIADGIERGSELALAGSAIGQVASTGEPFVLADLATSALADHTVLAAQGFASSMSVAIRAHGEVTAVLNVASVEPDAYAADELLAADTIAAVLAETLERIRAYEAVATRDRQLAAIVDDSPLLMVTVDSAGVIAQLSEFGASQLGHDPTEVRARPLTMLYPADQHELVTAHLADMIASEEGVVTSWEADMLGRDQQRLRVRHTGRRLADDGGSPASLVVCEDVTELVELSERLEHEASHDALTGLVNRREFDRQLSEFIQASSALSGCVCFVDVDQFKIINDTAGHRAGDAFLATLAATLTEQLQPDDLLARLGGDEFAVLLPGCSIGNAVRVAERLRGAAKDMIFSWSGRTFTVTLSIGVAAIDPARQDPDDVMGRADAACYDAKHEGRDRVSVAVPNRPTGRSSRPDGEWGSRLREALTSDDLLLYAQPIVPVAGKDERHRSEMLVRLRDDDGEAIAAGMFIPAAERLGIVAEIDLWVIARTVEILAALDLDQRASIDFVAVNLSPRSVESDGFIDDLISMVATPGLDPTKLLFEIAETAALSQFSKAVRFIETVAAVGCRFALDDFGAGFSTFHYLKRLPVDIVKIDGSLISDLARDPIDRSIVRSIAEVAATLGMSTIAECVDDPSTLARLDELGIDFAQGYSLGHPAPVHGDLLGSVLGGPAVVGSGLAHEAGEQASEEARDE